MRPGIGWCFARFLAGGLLFILAIAPSSADAAQAGVRKSMTFSSMAAAPNTDAAGKPKCCIGLDPNLTITVGQQAIGAVRFYCQDLGTGEFLEDKVKVRVTGFPRGHTEAAPLIKPKSVATNPPSNEVADFTIDTKYTKDTAAKTSVPQHYTLTITGTSLENERCAGDYEPLQATIAVAPLITGDKNEVWWFNDERPDQRNYQTIITLHAQPPGQPQSAYFWQLQKPGDRYARFHKKPDEQAEIETRAAPPKNTGNAKVTVAVNGVPSRPFPFQIRTPYLLKMACIVDTNRPRDIVHGTPFAIPGYRTFIGYQIRDQFNKLLGNAPIAANEHFDGPAQLVDPTVTPPWVRGPEAHFDFAPRDFHDVISVVDNVSTVHSEYPCVPHHPHVACLSARHHTIDQWNGGFNVGSDTIGSGLPVANLTWRRFQDHGRHCNLQTPLDEAAKNGCQTVTQRCTFPEQ